jgi:hypothetical protein
VNIIDDAAAHFLRAFARRRGCDPHAKLIVEFRLLLFEGLPRLVKVFEAGTMSFVIVPSLWGLLTGGSVR